jgi:hypothetical protein
LLRYPQYDLFLSAGIADDISFETDFLKKYNTVPCFAYDKPIHFVKKNIDPEESNQTTNLHHMFEQYSSVSLKMDTVDQESRQTQRTQYS